MKIISLRAENVKRLTAIEITPTGNVVTIAGKNGQGKSSILDCIWLALKASDAAVKMPIRKGQNKAKIRLDLGDLIVERRFTEAGSTLVVEGADGARFPSPQRMLDELLGTLSFDPLAFSRMDSKKQFDELKVIAQLDVDIDKLDALNKSDYSKRTDLNRDAKSKRAQADAIVVGDNLPDQPVDENAIVDQIQQAGEQNVSIERRKENRERVSGDIKKNLDSIPTHEARIAALQDEIDMQRTFIQTAKTTAAELQKKLDEAPPLPDPVDVSVLRSSLDTAKQTNMKIAARTRRLAIVKEAKALEDQASELTESMNARTKAKQDAIAAAKMPVPGLGFGDGIVTYNGVPFEQASSAEKLKTSLAIAMASNPRLRVIRIQDGSLLDEDSMLQVAQLAKDHDYQFWIEDARADGKVGIVISEGAVISTPESRATEDHEA